MAAERGALKPGMKADVNIIDFDQLRLQRLHMPLVGDRVVVRGWCRGGCASRPNPYEAPRCQETDSP